MGKASFNKHQRREQRESQRQEQRESGCFECRAMEVGQAAFDEVYARYGLRSEPAPSSRMVIPCGECGAPRNFDARSLDDEMRREFSNLRRMADRDTRLRREWSDELKRLWQDFNERYYKRCIMLFGLVYAEAVYASGQAMDAWLEAHAEERLRVFSQPPMIEKQKLKAAESERE